MTRINALFERKKNNILNVYTTAGFPALHDTIPVMEALQEYGADIIELGMPYSDPLADGPVIQHSSAVALNNGMTIRILFEQLRDMRNKIHVPVLLMGYMNPVLQYGFEQFCADAAAVGVDGLILPDLPAFEFEHEYGALIKKYGLDFIFLVTPETSDERVKQLDALSSGFLYAVSSSSTTGAANATAASADYLNRLASLPLTNPVLVGFGIKDRQSLDAVCAHAAGGIIGSAFVKVLENSTDIHAAVRGFLSSLR